MGFAGGYGGLIVPAKDELHKKRTQPNRAALGRMSQAGPLPGRVQVGPTGRSPLIGRAREAQSSSSPFSFSPSLTSEIADSFPFCLPSRFSPTVTALKPRTSHTKLRSSVSLRSQTTQGFRRSQVPFSLFLFVVKWPRKSAAEWSFHRQTSDATPTAVYGGVCHTFPPFLSFV